MKKLNQTGALDLMLVIALLAVLAVGGFVIWRVYDQKDTTKATTTEQSTQNQADAKDDNTTDEKKKVELSAGEIKEVDTISLIKAGDEENLPEYTPDSFVAYVKDLLQKNTPNENGCVTYYSVSKISSINISGGLSSVSADTNKVSSVCGGGAHSIWYLNDDNIWEQFGVQATPGCDAISDKNISVEFLEKCYSGTTEDSIIKNPNGSLADLSAAKPVTN